MDSGDSRLLRNTLKFFAFPLLAVVLVCAPHSSSAYTEALNYWVATDGDDQGSGSFDDPFLTLQHARDVVHASWARKVGKIYVNIRGGVYQLDETLSLDAGDSGAYGAEVVYQAAPNENVVISGGEQIRGWTLYDSGLNIWEAKVNTSNMPRQLYVNGERAVRARTPDYPNYYVPTATGYEYEYLFGSDPQIPPVWENPDAVEAVTSTQWKMMRCPVSSVENGSNVIMQNPGWENANVFPYPWNFHLLNWWENAYEFLDEPGEWYLNQGTQKLYYIPREGEDMSRAEVVLPVLEKLVEATGDVYDHLSFVQFKNLNFQYATWYEPNSPNGYVADQSGFRLEGSGHESNIIGHDPDTVATPGNLDFEYAQNITFGNNTFEHLGSVALNFGTGSQDNTISGNTFRDISAAAIQMGGNAAEDHHPQYYPQLTINNHIADNLIEYVGQEYYDAPGIYIGFTTGTIAEHNTISHVPWTGIATGWGWGLLDPGGFAGLPHATPYEWGFIDTPSASRNNQIVYNKIEYFLEKLWDGGAIYNTGFQGSSMEDGMLIAWNVAQHKRPFAGGNTFYTDGGSRFITVRENVSLDNPEGYVDFGPCLKGSAFIEADLCLLTGLVPYGADMGGCVPYGDMVFESNYLGDASTFYDICTNSYNPDAPTNMAFIGNEKVSSADQVPAWILNSAGIRGGY